jgi:hypothetical protein
MGVPKAIIKHRGVIEIDTVDSEFYRGGPPFKVNLKVKDMSERAQKLSWECPPGLDPHM